MWGTQQRRGGERLPCFLARSTPTSLLREVTWLQVRALHAGGRGAEGPGGGPRGHPHLGHAALLLLTGYQKTCLHFRDSGVCISDYVANL